MLAIKMKKKPFNVANVFHIGFYVSGSSFLAQFTY